MVFVFRFYCSAKLTIFAEIFMVFSVGMEYSRKKATDTEEYIFI